MISLLDRISERVGKLLGAPHYHRNAWIDEQPAGCAECARLRDQLGAERVARKEAERVARVLRSDIDTVHMPQYTARLKERDAALRGNDYLHSLNEQLRAVLIEKNHAIQQRLDGALAALRETAQELTWANDSEIHAGMVGLTQDTTSVLSRAEKVLAENASIDATKASDGGEHMSAKGT